MMNDGLKIYRVTCPEYFIDDCLYSIKTAQVPTIIRENVIIHENNIRSVMIKNLKEKIPFSCARYNDGEWISSLRIMEKGLFEFHSTKWKESGQEFVDKYLLPIIQSKPKYWIGIASEVFKRDFIMNHVAEHLLGLKLFDGGLMARWGLDNNFIDLIQTLANRNVIIVGPSYYSKMSKQIKFTHIITEDNVWLYYDNIKKKLDEALHGFDDPVILYSCSFVGKKLIDYHYHNNQHVTQIDIGAAFEPYCGMNLRPWHKHIKGF